MENINSKYILNIIISYVNEYTKLNLVKYNNNLKHEIDITLLNYRLFSERYIIYEQNGKVKEYNKYDALIYEGEYLNGKKNGKGKEYYTDDKLKFEREYLNGKKIEKEKNMIIMVI